MMDSYGSTLTILMTLTLWALSNSQVEQLFEKFPIRIPAPGFYLSAGGTQGGEAVSVNGTLLTLECYIDLACGDSKAAWPHMLQVAHRYHQHGVKVKIMQFPLPYHRNAMLLSQGALMLLKKKPSVVEEYIGAVLERLENWKAINTGQLTDSQLMQRLVSHIKPLTGMSTEQIVEDVKAQNEDARYEWKLGCTRGVSGTPSLFVNGVEIYGYVTPDSLRGLLNRLLGLGEQAHNYSVIPATNVSPSAASAGSSVHRLLW